MAFSDWRLCARLLVSDEFNDFLLVNFRSLGPGHYAIYKWNPFLNDGVPALYLGPYYYAGERFPHGYAVEPDTPI